MGSIGTIGKIIVALALVAGAVTALEVAARPAARKELVCPDDVGVAGPDEVERTYGGEYPRYQFRAVLVGRQGLRVLELQPRSGQLPQRARAVLPLLLAR